VILRMICEADIFLLRNVRDNDCFGDYTCVSSSHMENLLLFLDRNPCFGKPDCHEAGGKLSTVHCLRMSSMLLLAFVRELSCVASSFRPIQSTRNGTTTRGYTLINSECKRATPSST
jgi:hypothetical protein